MPSEQPVKATVIDVLISKGNRVYKLTFLGDAVKTSGFANLNLGKFTDEKMFFFNISPDGTIDANIHHCPDFVERDVFYAWQRRLPRLPTACPRCKRRPDMMSTRGFSP